MKKKHLLYIIVIFLLGFLSVVFLVNRSNTTLSNEETNFAVHDTANVVKIFLSDMNNNSVLLERQDSGAWIVNKNYPASKNSVDYILKTMRNVTVKAPVSKVSHDNVVKRLSSLGVKVEIYQNTHKIDIWGIKLFPTVRMTKCFYVGDNTQDNQGTYMLIDGAERPYITYIPGFTGFLHSRFSPFEKDWKTHTIFKHKVGEIQSLQFANFEEPEQSFQITKVGDLSFNLSNYNNQPFPNYDTIKLLDYLTGYNDIRYETVLDKIDEGVKDSILNSKGYFQIQLKDIYNKEVSLRAFRRAAGEGEYDMEGNPVLYDRDRMYAELSIFGKTEFVLIQYFVFDRLIKNIEYFSKDYIEDNKFEGIIMEIEE
jgi:hypothetical protein